MSRAAGTRPRWTWVIAAALAAVGAVALFVRPVAPALPPPSAAATALTTFSSETLDRVDAWVGPLRVVFLTSMAVRVGALWALLGTSRGRELVGRRCAGRFGTARAVLLVLLTVEVVTAPLRWWSGWVHSGRFGFRTSSPSRFAAEWLGSVALEALLVTITVTLLLWLVRRRPHDWPAVATIVGTALTATLVLVQPLVTTELLYDPQPLDDPELEAAMAPVVERSTLDDPPILVGTASVRTTRVNAFVFGIGPSQRIVLWDTLLELPTDQVVAVVGHELAHAEHRDAARGVLGTASGLLLVLVLAQRLTRDRVELARPSGRIVAAAAVTAALVLGQTASSPVVNWHSRRAEAAADDRALALVRDPAGAVALARGFTVDDLADPDPPAWVRLLGGSHPTVTQRIRAAVAFAEREGLDPVPPSSP